MPGQDGHWEQFDNTAALLVHPSGTIHPIVDCHEFTCKAACESRPGHPQPCHWSVWIVLECGFHVIKWISVFAGFWQIQSHIGSVL